MTADIRQAFLNIEIHEEHRNFLRFLWYDEVSKDDAKIIVLRFLRVVFGVNSSPFLLNATVGHHLDQYVECHNHIPSIVEFVERFLQDLYVDDEVSGAMSVEEGFQFYLSCKEIMSEAGFDMRKWVCNNVQLQDVINKHEGEVQVVKTIIEDDSSYVNTQFPQVSSDYKKVLGVIWDIQRDEFRFEFDVFVKKALLLELTKRNVLIFAASLYDPLGLISPVITRIKILFQLLCKDKLDWDDKLSDALLTIWTEILSDLKVLSVITVNRFVLSSLNEKYSISLCVCGGEQTI